MDGLLSKVEIDKRERRRDIGGSGKGLEGAQYNILKRSHCHGVICGRWNSDYNSVSGSGFILFFPVTMQVANNLISDLSM